MLIFHLRAGNNITPNLHLHPFSLTTPYSVLKAFVFVATGEQWHSDGRSRERREEPLESGAMRGLDLYLLAHRSRILGIPGHVGATTSMVCSTQLCSALLCPAVPCNPSHPVGPAVPLPCTLPGKEASAAVPGSAFLLQWITDLLWALPRQSTLNKTLISTEVSNQNAGGISGFIFC